MKEITYPIRAGYLALLDGIVVGGNEIEVFDMEAPYPEETPYIIIDGILPISENTKDGFLYGLTVDLLIYTAYQGDFGSRKPGDLIANAILNLIIPTPGRSGVSATGFNVYMAKLVGSNDERIQGGAKSVYRKRITIEHLAEQIS